MVFLRPRCALGARAATRTMDLATARFDCATLQDVRAAAACAFMDRPGKRARHDARMARCQWQRQSLVFGEELAGGSADAQIWRIGTTETQDDMNNVLNYGAVNAFPARNPVNEVGDIFLDVCTVEEEEEEERSIPATWLFMRIGPFETRGGYSWSRVLATLEDTSIIGRIIGDSTSRFYIGDHVVSLAKLNGSLLSYPPMHQHHSHLIQGGESARTPLERMRPALSRHGVL